MFEFGGDAIRVRKDSFDILKSKDVRRLIEIVRKNPKCDLWSSIPCGPWSTWQYVNLSQYGPEFAAELNDARRQSQIMFAAFIRVSREVRKGGGRIAYEWPRHCLGWSQPFMKKFLDDPEILTVNIDGCDFGMKDKNGAPIRKQWRRRRGQRDTGVSVEGYTITPDGEYYDPDSQETFQTLEAWKAQRRSSRHRVVRASATESKDPVHGGLEEPDERNPNYYGDDTEPKRGSIPLDEAFTRPDRFVLHHIAAREKNFEPIVASFANKARNSDQVSREQGDQSRTLNAAIPNDRHGVREMAKRATLVDWAHAYADKCTVHGPKQFQYVHFGKEATDRTEADEWTKVMETIVPPEYPPEIRDQIDSKFVTRKGESGDHHTGIFGKAKQPLGNSNSYPNRARCDAMVHDGTRLGMVDSRNGEVIPMDDVFWTAEYMNAYDLNSQLSAVRAGLDMALATAWRMGHVHPHMAGAVAGLQKIRTFYDCLHAAHRKTRLGSLPFHQIVGELDRVDDRGNKLEPNIPDTWRTTALRGEYPDCLAQSVAQVFRSMCGPLAMSGSREDRAVIIRRDESAFTRGDKIMGHPLAGLSASYGARNQGGQGEGGERGSQRQ